MDPTELLTYIQDHLDEEGFLLKFLLLSGLVLGLAGWGVDGLLKLSGIAQGLQGLMNTVMNRLLVGGEGEAEAEVSFPETTPLESDAKTAELPSYPLVALGVRKAGLRVYLMDAGDSPAAVTELICQLTGMPEEEARRLVIYAPNPIGEAESQAAETLQQLFQEAGAIVSLTPFELETSPTS
jgi:ribosomal protein L7/L12